MNSSGDTALDLSKEKADVHGSETF